MNDEQKLIKDLHEQLLLWMEASNKKDKWNHYFETAKTLEQAEKYLKQHGIEK